MRFIWSLENFYFVKRTEQKFDSQTSVQLWARKIMYQSQLKTSMNVSLSLKMNQEHLLSASQHINLVPATVKTQLIK